MVKKKEDIFDIVENALSKRKSIFNLVDKHETPFYAYDQEEMDESAESMSHTLSWRSHRFVPSPCVYCD